MLSLSHLETFSPPPASRLDRARRALGEHAATASSPARSQAHRSLEPGLHEWLPTDSSPPLAILIGLAWQAVVARPGRRVCWIGRQCWPYPHALLRRPAQPDGSGSGTALLEASVFIDARSTAECVWAAEVGLRCAGIGMVIADGRGIGMAESRRLQLAASAEGAAVQLIRQEKEGAVLSAARTRWRAEPQPGTGRGQAWSIELLRSKGGTDAWFGSKGARRCIARRDHATGTIGEWKTSDGDLAPEVGHRPASTGRAQIA